MLTYMYFLHFQALVRNTCASGLSIADLEMKKSHCKKLALRAGIRGYIMTRNTNESQQLAAAPITDRVVGIDLQSPEGELLELYCMESENWHITYKLRIEKMHFAIVGINFLETAEDRPHLRSVFEPKPSAVSKTATTPEKPRKPAPPVKPSETAKTPSFSGTSSKSVVLDAVLDGKDIDQSPSSAPIPRNTIPETKSPKAATRSKSSPSERSTPPENKNAEVTKHQKEVKSIGPVEFTTPLPDVTWSNPATERANEMTQVIRKINSMEKRGLLARLPLPLALFLTFWISPKSYNRHIQTRLGLGTPWNVALLASLALAGILLLLGGVYFNPELFVYLQISPISASLPVSDFFHLSLAHPLPVFVDQIVTLAVLSVTFHILLSVFGYTANILVTFFLLSIARTMYMVVVVAISLPLSTYSLGFQLAVLLGIGLLGLWQLARSFSQSIDIDVNRFFVTGLVFALVTMLSVPMSTMSLPWQQLKESLFRNSGLAGNLEMIGTILKSARNNENRSRLEAALKSQRSSIADIGLENYLPLNLNQEHVGDLFEAYDSEKAQVQRKQLQAMLGDVAGLTDDRKPNPDQNLPLGEGAKKLLAILEERHPDLKREYETLMASNNTLGHEQARHELIEKILALEDLQGFKPATMKVIGVILMENDLQVGQENALQFSLCRVLSNSSSQSVGTPSQVLWNFDYQYEKFTADRKATLSETVTHRWETPGNYIVAARILTDSGELSQILTQNVTVEPVLRIQPERNVVFSPDGKAVEVRWSFLQKNDNPEGYTLEVDLNHKNRFNADVTMQNQLATSIVPKKKGVSTIAARVRLPGGSAGEPSSFTLVSGSKAVARWIASQGPFVAGQPATLYGLAQKHDEVVYWDLNYQTRTFTKDKRSIGPEPLTHAFRYPGKYRIAYRSESETKAHTLEISVQATKPEVELQEVAEFDGASSKEITLTAVCSTPQKTNEDFTLQWDTSYDGRTFRGKSNKGKTQRLKVARPDRGQKVVAARCVDSAGKKGPVSLHRVPACPAF